MTIGVRMKKVRKVLNLNQTEFGERIGLKQTAIGLYENNQRRVADRTILLVCEKFNVNETWLRTGESEMFVQMENFSLDEYAKKKNLTQLELDIIKAYIELDGGVREKLLDHFKAVLNKPGKEAIPAEEIKRQKLEEYSQ